jgi:Tfp pilus assembly protein FimT
MKTKSLTKGFSTIAAGVAVTVASFFVAVAVPQMSPTLRARQLDNSAQEVAGFLQQARTLSVERKAPVACRVEMDGSHTVLTLDWNFNGSKMLRAGQRLELPRGMVLMQAGVLQKSGTLAVFNPRGGVMIGSDRFGSEAPAVLSLSRRGGPTTELREIALTGGGDFKVAPTTPKA